MAGLAFHQVESMCNFVGRQFTPSLAGISRRRIKTGCIPDHVEDIRPLLAAAGRGGGGGGGGGGA